MPSLHQFYKKDLNTTIQYYDPSDFTDKILIVVDCTLGETHSDKMIITKHPVEYGSDITDHANIMPVTFSMTGLQSSSPLSLAKAALGNLAGAAGMIGGAAGTIASLGTAAIGGALLNKALDAPESRVLDSYQALLMMKEKKLVLTISTGIRVYTNMMCSDVTVPRDNKSGESLKWKANFEEIIIVQSETTKVIENVTSDKSGLSEKSKQGKNASKAVNDKVSEKANNTILYKSTKFSSDYLGG